MYQKIMEM